MDMNNKEINAAMRKLEHPEDVVKCPRCGSILEFFSYGSADQVKCTTENCIEMTIRGI